MMPVMPGVRILLGRFLHDGRLGGARCTTTTETCPTGDPANPSRSSRAADSAWL
jgi:hypothetical protein